MMFGLLVGEFGLFRTCRSSLQNPTTILHTIYASRAKDHNSLKMIGREMMATRMISLGSSSFACKKRYKDAHQCTLQNTSLEAFHTHHT
jgi:hypothetical protein